mgnify:FL=1
MGVFKKMLTEELDEKNLQEESEYDYTKDLSIDKKIIQAIKEWLTDNIVTDDEISEISDGTHDIVYGRKELAVSLLEKIHTWERFPENINIEGDK